MNSNLLTTLAAGIGLGDGAGNISSMRVINLLVVLSVLVPHVVLTLKSGVITPWSEQDLMLLGIALGAKLVQNHQETKTDKQP